MCELSDRVICHNGIELNVRQWKRINSVIFMLVLGAVGAFILAINEFIDQIAEQCGSSSIESGSLFLANFLGSITGSFGSAEVYKQRDGNFILAMALFTISGISIAYAYNTSIIFLNVLYFIQGIFISLADTGCQFLISKIQGANSGPWLMMGQFSLSFCGAFIIFVNTVLSVDLKTLFWSLAGTVTACGIVTLLIPSIDELVGTAPSVVIESDNGIINEESHERSPLLATDSEKPPNIHTSSKNRNKHYYSEILASATILCLIGGMTTLTAFIYTYADETGFETTDIAEAQAYTLWFSMSVGTLVFVLLQQYLITNANTIFYLLFMIVLSIIAASLLVHYNTSETIIWVSIVLYGFAARPATGLCFQWITISSYCDELSMSIALVGLNIGGCVVPYMTTILWDDWLGSESVFLIVLTVTVIALPLPLLSAWVSYRNECKPWMSSFS